MTYRGSAPSACGVTTMSPLWDWVASTLYVSMVMLGAPTVVTPVTTRFTSMKA